MSPVLVFRRLILLLTAIFFLGLWYHLLSETAIQTIGGLSKGTMTLSGLHHDSSAASKEMTPSPSTDWMHEPLAIESKNEFIKFHGNEAPSGYRMMDCQESKGLEHKLLNCVDDWEICGFSGNIGKASGRRGDLSPSVDCESREQGYGCYIARKMGLFDMRAYEEPIMPGKSRAASRSYVVKRIKSDLASYVSSPEFEKRTKQISLENTTGIVILAGSARSTSLALITIKMIRHGIYMSNISIELHWQKDEKMDSVTWGVIQQAFAPIDGFDIASRWKEVYPNLIKDLQLRKASGFPAKVASLLVTRFQHVLMMEANSMLMLPPSVLFRNPHYKINGNIFWPSTQQGKVDECAYQKLGLKSKETRLSLDGGKGCCPRGTSGGQLLINRAMHLDVLMFALANAQAHEGSCSLAGLKAELFPLAFAQTSKAHLFCQVEAPPSGIFSWRPKDQVSGSKSDGWQWTGWLQHDSFVRPAFIQLVPKATFNIGSEPQSIDLISAPVPQSWVGHYLGSAMDAFSNQLIPTEGFTIMTASETPSFVHQVQVKIDENQFVPDPLVFTTNSSQHCPFTTFLSLFEMRRRGLSIDGLNNDLVIECYPMLKNIIGSKAFDELKRKGYLMFPMLQALDHVQHLPSSTTLIRKIPAYRPSSHTRMDQSQPPNAFPYEGPFMLALRQYYRSHTWLRRYAHHFPALIQSNMST